MNNNKPGCLLIILTIIIPPLGVFLKVGVTKHFFINLLLTFIGFYICGIIHGLWVIFNVNQIEFKSPINRALNSRGIKFKIKGVN
jgi:uncharacterized membrane protein YqaE (UPF0057 family)